MFMPPVATAWNRFYSTYYDAYILILAILPREMDVICQRYVRSLTFASYVFCTFRYADLYSYEWVLMLVNIKSNASYSFKNIL